jgi:hypothetical protein
MHYTIYKITNKINGKFYIGSHKTKNLDDNYMGSGKYLKYAQEKYGLDNFEKDVLYVFDNPEEMYAKEAEIVNEEFLAMENTYNIKVGGFGGWDYNNTVEGQKLREHSYRKWQNAGLNSILNKLKTDEEFKKQFKSRIKKLNNERTIKCKELYPNGTFYGKTHSDETKQKMKQSAIGKHDGEKNSQYGTMWITNGVENKKIKKDTIIPNGWNKGRKCP